MSSGWSPITEQRTVAQKEDLLAKFHTTREKHDQDLTQVSLLKSLRLSIVPDHLPEDGTDARQKVQAFKDGKASREDQAPLSACT